MPTTKPVLQCKANRVLVDRLQSDIDMYLESRKDRMVIILRKALHSIIECPKAIRCKEHAKGLKGVGDFVASRIESILYHEHLLNVEPNEDELVPETPVVEIKKSTISSYVPRMGGLTHYLLISTLLVCGENHTSFAELEGIEYKIHEINSSFQYHPRKLNDSIRLLQTHDLIKRHDYGIELTNTGKQLGVLCVKECCTTYPVVQHFIEEGLLQQFETDNQITFHPLSPPPSKRPIVSSTGLELPPLQWPLSSPPSNTLFAEQKLDLSSEKPNETPSFVPVSISSNEEDWKVLLLLDNREVRTVHDRNFLENQLREYGVDCERRSLSLGDMQWILQNIRTNQEVMLNFIVERKNTRDLASSICDGRFNEQQYRLLHCGCQYPIYLIEGNVRSQDLLPSEVLQGAMMTTVLSRDIYIYQSTSIDDTVVFLKNLNDIIHTWVRNYFSYADEQCFHPQKISYTDFQTIYTKIKTTTLKTLWSRQLCLIPKCTPAKALIITQHYPTLASLLAKYKQLYTTKEKEDLLKNLCDEQHNNKIGPALSRDIYHLLCDL